MVLELYVWGPAFGLPSLDAECLAAVAYLSAVLPASNEPNSRRSWRLVASDPSVSPTYTLPALHHDGVWTSGYDAIVTYLCSSPLSATSGTTLAEGDVTEQNQLRPLDLDARLSPSQRADVTAYGAFLASQARALVDLSLYVSDTNWSETTMPAYTAAGLGFPLTWTIPPAVRAAAVRRAQGLGVDLAAADAEDFDAQGAPGETAGSRVVARGGKTEFPRDFVNRFADERRGVLARMTPEEVSAISLVGLAEECFSVLDLLRPWGRDGEKGSREELRSFFAPSPPSSRPIEGKVGVTSLDCLTFGYLALMTEPNVPRDWLRGTLHRSYPELELFVADIQRSIIGPVDELPWSFASKVPPRSTLTTARTFLHTTVQHIPTLGQLYAGEWRRRLTENVSGLDGRLLSLSSGAITVALLLGGCYRLFRTNWGAPLLIWRPDRKRSRLSEFGALGSMLDMGFGAAAMQQGLA